MENNNPKYFAVIPARIRYDESLKNKAKLLYGEIYCLSDTEGYCYNTNNYFADLFGVTKETISRLITDLVNKGYITRKIIYKEGSKEIIGRRLQCQYLE